MTAIPSAIYRGLCRLGDKNASLAATGAVWTRYCFVIVPKNYYLASVNFFVFCTGMVQILRIAHYRHTLSKVNEVADLKPSN
ncbi:Mitochondrial pyruvate carrier [Meloidogyne graminicola]|uniref:Mitochondrial pyruvate carrier n=1 Tax=Meloidogyne graminicola TaxID=189291 RepID=A0A8T0A0H5_9BILA|nr:Mitochondrial pyruvate carrier [Meloidogyne graminicola]